MKRITIAPLLLLILTVSACSLSGADRKLKTWDFSNGTQGWKPLVQVELKASDGALHIRCKGRDPHLMAPVDSIEKSTVSLMPSGLINTLSKPDILDLLAYIESGGNPEHPNFRK